MIVYDIMGRKVRVLQDGALSAGSWSFEWDGRDENGAMVSTGVYITALSAPGVRARKKMLFLK